MSITKKKTKPKPVKRKSMRPQQDANHTPKKSSKKIAETTPTSTFKATSEATPGEVDERLEHILEKLTIDGNRNLVKQLFVQYYLKGYMSDKPKYPQATHFEQPFHTKTRNNNEYNMNIKPFFETIASCNLLIYFAEDFVTSLKTIHNNGEEKDLRIKEWQKKRNDYFAEYKEQDETDTGTFMDYLVNNKQLHPFVTEEHLKYVFGKAFLYKKFQKSFIDTKAKKILAEQETETVAEPKPEPEPESETEPEPETETETETETLTLKRKSQNKGAEISKKQKQEAEAAAQDKLAAAAAAAAAATLTYEMMKVQFNKDENSSDPDTDASSDDEHVYHDKTLGKTTGQLPAGFQTFVLSLQHFTSLNSERYYCPCSASQVSKKWREAYAIDLNSPQCHSKAYTSHLSMMQHIKNTSRLQLYHQAIAHYYENLMSKEKAVTLTTSDTADKVMEASSSTAGTGGKETSDIVGGDSTSQERESTVMEHKADMTKVVSKNSGDNNPADDDKNSDNDSAGGASVESSEQDESDGGLDEEDNKVQVIESVTDDEEDVKNDRSSKEDANAEDAARKPRVGVAVAIELQKEAAANETIALGLRIDGSSDEGGNEVEANARNEAAKRAGDRVEHENADNQTCLDNNCDELFDNEKEDEESTSTSASVQHMINDDALATSGDATGERTVGNLSAKHSDVGGHENADDQTGPDNNDDRDSETRAPNVESTFHVQPGNIVSLRRMSSKGQIAHAFENYAIAEVEKTDSGPAFSFVRMNDEGKRNGGSPILKLFPPYEIIEGMGKHFYQGSVKDQWVRLERTSITLTDGVPMFINTITDRLFSNYEGDDPNLIAQREAFNEQKKRDEAAKARDEVATKKAAQQITFHSNIVEFGLDLSKFKTLAQTDVDTPILGNVIDPQNLENVLSEGTPFFMSVGMYGQVHLVQDRNFHGYSICRKSDLDPYQFIDAYCSSVDKKTIIETLNLSSLLDSLNLNEKGLTLSGTERFSLFFILEGTIANMYRDGIDISVTKVTCPSQQWRNRMGNTLLHPKAPDGTHYYLHPYSAAAMTDGEELSPQSFQNKCVHIPFEFMSHLPQSVTLATQNNAFTTVSQLLQSRFETNRGEVCATYFTNEEILITCSIGDSDPFIVLDLSYCNYP
jgi:hypothetical protein